MEILLDITSRVYNMKS